MRSKNDSERIPVLLFVVFNYSYDKRRFQILLKRYTPELVIHFQTFNTTTNEKSNGYVDNLMKIFRDFSITKQCIKKMEKTVYWKITRLSREHLSSNVQNSDRTKQKKKK